MRRQSRRSLTLAALVGAWLAAACNYLLYLVYYATGIIPWNMLSPGRGVSITPRLVLFVSVGGALGGALLYAIIERVSTNPVRMFKLIAGVILILSFAAPLMIETFTTSLMLGLYLMHIVVFASTFWALTVWREGSGFKASA
jgi:uncharacterized protein DUF6069